MKDVIIVYERSKIMGLDGISINQLRLSPDYNSAELNSVNNLASNEVKVVDGLSQGQRVDPDKESEHDNSQPELSKNDSDENQEEEEILDEPVTTYDLSDTKKYMLKLDEESNKILIIDKNSAQIIQSIDADALAKFVIYSPNSCGSIISKKL